MAERSVAILRQWVMRLSRFPVNFPRLAAKPGSNVAAGRRAAPPNSSLREARAAGARAGITGALFFLASLRARFALWQKS
jgi:hypothetical protein